MHEHNDRLTRAGALLGQDRIQTIPAGTNPLERIADAGGPALPKIIEYFDLTGT